MFWFYYKIGPIKQPPITKVMGNQNFNFVYLGSRILCLQTYLKKKCRTALKISSKSKWKMSKEGCKTESTILFYVQAFS